MSEACFLIVHPYHAAPEEIQDALEHFTDYASLSSFPHAVPPSHSGFDMRSNLRRLVWCH